MAGVAAALGWILALCVFLALSSPREEAVSAIDDAHKVTVYFEQQPLLVSGGHEGLVGVNDPIEIGRAHV